MPGYVLGARADLAPLVTARKFGVRWYKNQSTTTLTRLHDAVGKTFKASVGSTTAGSSGFDNEPIYKDIKLCNVVNGKVTAYYGEPGFSRTPSSGDVMVEIPRYYYKIEETSTYRDFIISDQPLDGFLFSPRHAPHSGNANGYEKIYVSAYTLNSSYRSVSGNSSVVSITRATARTGCKGRGNGYYLYDFATYWTIALLYLIEVADWNSQNVIGEGYTDSSNSAQINTGGADGVSGHTGRASGNATNAKNAVKYRHMENLWGNIWSWCDGANFNDALCYVCTNPAQYADDTATNYTKLSYSKATADGYQKALGFDPNVPWAQICTDATGADGTYISDYYYRSTGWRVLPLGGSWHYTRSAGLFYLDSGRTSSSTSTYVGCRLLVLP
ncbi:hypothetical protein [Clostridium sp. D33t1_170424_F3]|uniref:hypothetical protein n=1 Tax=Clostridium sp. D33t1_170424_F3 TaxID=2787099 RepID=UPI0018ABF3F7|nr:hypothetical protein [Clostridium sp. D33t1_170424_F3]